MSRTLTNIIALLWSEYQRESVVMMFAHTPNFQLLLFCTTFVFRYCTSLHNTAQHIYQLSHSQYIRLRHQKTNNCSASSNPIQSNTHQSLLFCSNSCIFFLSLFPLLTQHVGSGVAIGEHGRLYSTGLWGGLSGIWGEMQGHLDRQRSRPLSEK